MKVPDMSDPKQVLDAANTLAPVAAPVLTLLGWVANALPPLAALVSILWMGWQWYHSAPMKAKRDAKRKKRSVK